MGLQSDQEPAEHHPPPIAMPRYINDIIIHCSASPYQRDDRAADIKAWHTAKPPKGNGWSNIGYHYIIDLDGTIEHGRPISQPGAHCKRHNAHSIGVCYVGGLGPDGKPADTRTAAQRQSMLQLITKLTMMYCCHVHGHRDYDPGKSCPCFDVAAEYGGIYAQVVRK